MFKKLLATLLLCTSMGFGQVRQLPWHGLVTGDIMFSVAQPPLCNHAPVNQCGNSGFYTPLQTAVFQASTNGVPNRNLILGYAPLVFWNAVDNSPFGTGNCANQSKPCYDWSDLDASLLAILVGSGTQGNPASWNGPKFINLLFQLASQLNNNATPTYVFTKTYSDSIGAAQQAMVVNNNYPGTGNSPFGLTGQVLQDSNASGPGTSCTSSCRYIYDPAGVTGINDTTGLPISYQAPFSTASKAFLQQIAVHFSANCEQGLGGVNGNDEVAKDCAIAALVYPHMGYNRVGPTAGAEANPSVIPEWTVDAGFSSMQDEYVRSTTGTLPNGSKNTNYIQDFIYYFADQANANNVPWLVDSNMHAIANGPKTDPDLMAQYAAFKNTGFGTNGLQTLDIYNYPAGSSVADVVKNFNTYRGQAFLQLQTLTVSDPTCPMDAATRATVAATGLLPCSSTTGGAYGSLGSATATGSLDLIVPWGVAHYTQAIELYPCDIFMMFEPNWTSLPGNGAGSSGSDCKAAFTHLNVGGNGTTNFPVWGGPTGRYYQMLFNILNPNNPQYGMGATGKSRMDGKFKVN